MADFETLVNEFIDEFGIGGGGTLTTLDGQTHAVVGQTGQFGRAVRWIKESDTYIQLLWDDWDFLWNEWTGSLAAASQAPTVPTVSADGYIFRQFDRSSFFLNKGLASHKKLTHEDYDLFRQNREVGTVSAGRPTYITEKPDGTLRVNRPSDAVYTFDCAGWQAPVAMSIDSSESSIPDQFERIIKTRAAIYYADKEDAPEILEGAQAEYADLLEKLESQYAPAQRWNRMGAQDIPLEVEVPGQVSGYVTR